MNQAYYVCSTTNIFWNHVNCKGSKNLGILLGNLSNLDWYMTLYPPYFVIPLTGNIGKIFVTLTCNSDLHVKCVVEENEITGLRENKLIVLYFSTELLLASEERMGLCLVLKSLSFQNCTNMVQTKESYI